MQNTLYVSVDENGVYKCSKTLKSISDLAPQLATRKAQSTMKTQNQLPVTPVRMRWANH